MNRTSLAIVAGAVIAAIVWFAMSSNPAAPGSRPAGSDADVANSEIIPGHATAAGSSAHPGTLESAASRRQEDREHRLLAQYGGVTVTVLRDRDRSPVPDARVVLNARLGAPWTNERIDDPLADSRIAPTDATGQTTAPAIPGELVAIAGDWIGMAKSRDGRAPVEILMRPRNQPLRVLATDPSGVPASGVPVVLLSMSSLGPGAALDRATTNADGRATFANAGALAQLVKASQIMIAVELPGAGRHPEATATLDCDKPLSDEVRLQMPPTVPVELIAQGVPEDVDPGTLLAELRDEIGSAIRATSLTPGTWTATACTQAVLRAKLTGGGVVGWGRGAVPERAVSTVRVPVQVFGRMVTVTGTVEANGAQALWAGVPPPDWAPPERSGPDQPLHRRWVQLAADTLGSRFSIELPRSTTSEPTEVSFRVSGPLTSRGRPTVLNQEELVLELDLSQDIDVGTLSFSVLAITGRVVDGDGAGLAGARVEVQRAQEDAMDLDGDGSNTNWHDAKVPAVTTATDGRFVIVGLGHLADDVRLMASPRGFAPVVSAAFKPSAPPEIELEAQQAGGLEGRVFSRLRSRAENVEMWFRAADGLGRRVQLGPVQDVAGGYAREYLSLGLEPGTQKLVLGSRQKMGPGDDTVLAGSVAVAPGRLLTGPMDGNIDLDQSLQTVRVTPRFDSAPGANSNTRFGTVALFRSANGQGMQQFFAGESLVLNRSAIEWSNLVLLAEGYQALTTPFADGSEPIMKPQAPLHLTLAPELAQRLAAADSVVARISFVRADGAEPIQRATLPLTNGALEWPACTSGTFAIELFAKPSSDHVGIQCVPIEVPPREGAPIQIALEAAR